MVYGRYIDILFLWFLLTNVHITFWGTTLANCAEGITMFFWPPEDRMDDYPIFQTLSDKNCMIDVSIMLR